MNKNLIKKISYILGTTTLLILSGCSSSGGSFFNSNKNEVPQQDITGTGLKIKLELDDQWISQKKVNYRLDIENTGSKEIELDSSNIQFYTLQTDNSGSKNAFTQNSIQDFKDSILDYGDTNLPQNAKISGVSGQFEIEDWIFNNLNQQKIDYTLKITYNAETKFNNNLEIQKLEKIPLKVTDKLSQAAPVQINKITLSPFEGDLYYLTYQIKDKANTNDEYSVKLENFDINFGGKTQTGCSGFIQKSDGTLDKTETIILNKKNPSLQYICKVDLSNFDQTKTTTSTWGSFTYEYTNIQSGTINLPTERKTQDLFE